MPIAMKRAGRRFSDPSAQDPDLEAEDGEEGYFPKEIEDTEDLRRILAIPRRPMPDASSPEAEQLAATLTERFRNPDATELYPGPLRGLQAVAIREAWSAKGLVGTLKAGSGKTLASAIIMALYAASGYERILYMCPGGELEAGTRAEFAKMAKCWRLPPLRLLTYDKLSSPGSSELVDTTGYTVRKSRIERMAPQVLVLDECHSLANAGSAVTRRMRMYLEKYPETIVILLTGTPFKTSVNDFSHLVGWALKERSPFPLEARDRRAWGGYLDARKPGSRGRTELGALKLLDASIRSYSDQDTGELARARNAVARRLYETAGVIGSAEQPVNIPLTFEPWYPVAECPKLNETYDLILTQKKLPDDTQLADEISVNRHLVTVGRGHYNIWDPAPPESWKIARNTWSKWCRKAIKRNKVKATSEATVKSAIRKGQLTSGAALLDDWEAEDLQEQQRTGLREPPSVPQWVSNECIEAVRLWTSMHTGLVWVENIGLGERLADSLRLSYYGSGGLDSRGSRILHHVPGTSAIASLSACGTGLNLQGIWSNALWLCAPNEQAIARIHRPGQQAEIVRNWVYIGCYQHLASFDRARDVKAAFQGEMTLTDLKLAVATVTVPDKYELAGRSNSLRWREPSKDDEDGTEDE